MQHSGKSIHKAAILGAGTMGHGIAQLFAANGVQVRLYDVNEKALQAAGRHIRRSLELIAGETAMDRIERFEQRIAYTTSLADAVAGVDLVVEAAPENLELKRTLYRQLEQLVGPETLIASNTSTYPLEELSRGMSFAERMLILHFFNPAVHVPLVEIVAPSGMKEDALDSVLALLRGCGKTPVRLKRDVPGFIANRLQAALLREALFLLENGVADASDIDAAVKHGPGLRWALHGPLETADFGGLDVWAKVSGQLFPLLDDSRAAPELLQRKVREGSLGVKSGRGLYDYADAAAVERELEARDRRLLRVLRARE